MRASLAPFGAAGGADLGEVEAALRAGVRLVAVSAVQFRSGLRMPLEALGELCRRHGAALCVDAAQGAGLTPLPVGAADFVAAPGHKWLMGPEGTGFLFIQPDQHLLPRLAGWLSHEQAADFLHHGPGVMRYDKPIRASADFLEGGAPNLVGFAGLEAGLAAIQRVGRVRIFSHVQIYLDALEAGLLARDFVSLRAPDISRRSGILSVECPPGLTAAAVAAALRKRGVSVTTPDGALRFSPHWPNAQREVPRVLDTLDEAMREARGERPPTLVDRARERGLALPDETVKDD
ncbi:MAG: aminotransferase class V-fold PLP-dependent enzyme [bacterium]